MLTLFVCGDLLRYWLLEKEINERNNMYLDFVHFQNIGQTSISILDVQTLVLRRRQPNDIHTLEKQNTATDN